MDHVSVLNPEGQQLAPCHPARARQLLRRGRAQVVEVEPYTIQLLPKDGEAAHVAADEKEGL